MFRARFLFTLIAAPTQTLCLLRQNHFSSPWQILTELTLLAGPYLTSLPPRFYSLCSHGHMSRLMAQSMPGWPPSRFPTAPNLLFVPPPPPLYRKLACLQPMNMPINPLFEQYDLLRIGLPGAANTEKGIGGFAVIHISLDLFLLLDLFSLLPRLYLCPFVSLIHLLPQVGGRSWFFFPIAQAAMMGREILTCVLSVWVLETQGLGSSGLEGLLSPTRNQRVETLCLEVEFEMTVGSAHCICTGIDLRIYICKVVGCV